MSCDLAVFIVCTFKLCQTPVLIFFFSSAPNVMHSPNLYLSAWLQQAFLLCSPIWSSCFHFCPPTLQVQHNSWGELLKIEISSLYSNAFPLSLAKNKPLPSVYKPCVVWPLSKSLTSACFSSPCWLLPKHLKFLSISQTPQGPSWLRALVSGCLGFFLSQLKCYFYC